MSLENKVALITGGSRGIGFATAKLFLKSGAKVVITSKNSESLDNATKKLQGCFAVSADVTKTQEVVNVVQKTIQRFGHIDILVNNAGVFPRIKKLHEIDESDWNHVLDVNLTGPFRYTKEVIPHMLKTGGSIINISSDAGLKAYQDFNADAYSASKAALILLTKSWALQYATQKIRVNCICPGVVDTDMTAPFMQTEAERDFMNKDHPIGRIGTPQEVAKAILYFASDDSSWTTGAVLAVDGGESVK